MSEQEQPKYTQIKAGVPTIMGLQAIKTMILIKGYKGVSTMEGPNKGKYVEEPDKYGFRFVYRAHKDTSAFVNEKLKGLGGERSNFHKRLQGMCPASLGKLTDPEMASMMVELVNRWYLVTVKDGKLMNDGKPWQDVVSVAALPPDLSPVMTPHEYFDSLGGQKVTPAENSKEGYMEVFTANRCIREGKPIPTRKPAQEPASVAIQTGFETMPNVNSSLPEHWYDIAEVKPHMFEKAEALLKQYGGTQPNSFRLSVWKTLADVPKLEKYKIDAPPTQSDFDKDELGSGF